MNWIHTGRNLEGALAGPSAGKMAVDVLVFDAAKGKL